MKACRQRTMALTSQQYLVIWFGLTGGYSDRPIRNAVIGEVGKCARIEQMVLMGLLKFVHDEVPRFRRYDVTEVGAAAVGLGLPD